MPLLNGLYAGWMVLNNMLGELKSKGVYIPDFTYADFRNSKMVLEYLRSFENEIRSPESSDMELQIEMEAKINRIRETLMIWAEEKEGTDYRLAWEKQFDDAIQGKVKPEDDESRIPISDLPREKDVGFFRIKLPDEIPVEIISELAEDCRVLILLDGDRHLQVSGKRDCVRDAMKKLGELFYGDSKLK